MIEQVQQGICINFTLNLNIPLRKLFRWFRSPGIWTTGDWQLHHNNAPAHASHLCAKFFGKTSNHSGNSAPLKPRLGALWLLAFPKTKITFEREEILDCWWDSGKYGAVDGNWENCMRSQGAYFEGDRAIIALYMMFLVSFSYYVAGCLLDRPHTCSRLTQHPNKAECAEGKVRAEKDNSITSFS